MKKFLFLIALPMVGQILVPSMTSNTVQAGGSGVVNLTFTTQSASVASFQWNTGLPAGVTGTWTINSSLAASKSLSCNNAGTICVIYGLNETPIPTGQVASFAFNVGSSLKGNQTITFGPVLGASPAGLSVTVNSSNQVVNVQSPFDLNVDGSVDVIDLGLAVRQVVGLDPCGTADFNADGKCNVIDLFLLIQASGN